MREIYKTYSQKGKKQLKTTTISIALLVVATLIFSSALPAMPIQTQSKKLNEIETKDKDFKLGDITGLDPQIKPSMTLSQAQADSESNPIAEPLADTGYCMNAISTPYKTYYYPLESPSEAEVLSDADTYYWLAGGTWSCDHVWYGVQYNNGLLWTIDPYTGECTEIGGGGTGLNGCAWDPVYNRLYGAASYDFYEINPEDGSQEYIGSFGIGSNAMICIAFDLSGVCYGWDVKFSGNAILYTIDIETGEATEKATCNMNLLYAQDGTIDWDTGICWLSAYNTQYGAFGATMDLETGDIEYIENFPSNTEMTCMMAMGECIPPEHDVGVKSIDSPLTGRAEPNMDMTITVKNSGNNTETFDAQMEIIKCEAGPIIYQEYFDDCVLPEGWDTDYWSIVYSNTAGGQPCEARIYKYDQYYGGQYYDNYIMSPATDCTGAEKVNLRFRWAGDYGTYAQYASVYVKFRRNSTSPWKDVSPWDNPVGSNQEGQLYEIGCYGFGQPIGEEFQMMWNYIGYYYYFNYLWLDDVTLEACGGCAEYAELVTDVTLAKGEEKQIQFPKWTPSEWHNESAENTWEEYPVHAFVILDGDQQPRNDHKWYLLDLWYPWMHDIEVMSIDSPHGGDESLPGQTFPVQATMRNVGQYAECCIPIDLSIGEPLILGTLFTEYDWPGSYYYPGQGSGWTDEHDFIAYYYGWIQSSTSQSGGSPYEAMLPYYYAYQDYYFYSMAFDTSDYGMLRLQFLSMIDHFSGTGLYSLEAGYSYDAKTWYAAWHVEPSGNANYDVDVPMFGGSETTYIGFWVKGNPYYFDYWYIDNVQVVAMGFEEEYYDFACQGPDIEPGEEVVFTFEDWTPDFLQYEETGTKEYIVEATIEMVGDKNPGNDIKTEQLTLDFWHDVGIDRVTSPTGGHADRVDLGELLWDNGEPDGVNGLFFGQYIGYDNWLIDDFEVETATSITGLKLHFVWGPGYSENLKEIWICIVEETGNCKPDPADPPYALMKVGPDEFEEYTTGTYYFSRPEIVVEAQFEGVAVTPGTWWIGAMPVGTIDSYSYWLTAPMKNCCGQWHAEYFGYPRWSPVSNYGYNYNFAWKVYYGGGAPKVKAWIQPGTEDIDAVVKNYGTFKKEDLTCYAEIREYITDPENGTQVYTDEIGNIDLTTPLGGEKNLQFADFTFADEGRYGLFLNLPADPDDNLKNNQFVWGIGVDDTPPYSDDPPILDPSIPDGKEGWYVSDVTVTLNATDPVSHDVSSGVKEIIYTINDGAEQKLPGKTGSFIVNQDGEDILIKYWAVDWVGNVEPTKHQFTLDIDQTVPEVDLTYEVTGGSPLTGWEFTFTATATDAMSGMERVEFALNDLLQHTVTGPGPTYTWTLMYFPIPHAKFTATAFDIAGLHDFDDVFDPVTSPHSHSIPQQQTNQLPNAKPLPR